MYDWLIVGAGFAGSVLAERIASQRGETVLIIDRRNHIGGNAFDHFDDAGILIHKYGPHIFHTNSDMIHDYLSTFTKWRPYEHRVLAHVDGQLVPIPINRTTINRLFGLSLKTDEDVTEYYERVAEKITNINTSEDAVVAAVGRELYEKFFRGYTIKQWGLDPSALDKSVTSRVPARTNTDDRYFSDKHQNMPLDGYTRMFTNMLSNPLITVKVDTEFNDIRNEIKYNKLIVSGPIDEFFDYRYGKLPYRSLRFVHTTKDCAWWQPTAVVNFPQTEEYTRITEYKHITGQQHERTSLTFEYPSGDGDPYYPVPQQQTYKVYKQYESMQTSVPNTVFVGRLATYKYYNMDQVVGQALATFRRIEERWPLGS